MNTAGIPSLDEIEGRVLNAVCREARKLGITQGVAAVLVLENGASNFYTAYQVNGSIERDPDPARGPDDRGTNYLGVVSTKIAEMVSTDRDSGTASRTAKVGETGFRGGRTDERISCRVFVAYSGGTQEQDLICADAGMIELKEIS